MSSISKMYSAEGTDMYFWGLNYNGMTPELIEAAKDELNKGDMNVVDIDGDTISSIESKVGDYYNITSDDGVGDLSFILPTMSDSTKLQTIVFSFTTGDDPNVTFTTADNYPVYYFEGFSIEPNTSYEINCMFNGSRWVIAQGIVEKYLRFEDPKVLEALLNAGIGDGVGVTDADIASVTDLGAIFKNNTQITSFNELKYFTGLTSIGADAFYGCSNLVSVVLPSTVTSIGNGAFYGCSKLTSINIPNSITSIGTGAFQSCSGLTSVTIPDTITSINSNTFNGCTGLTSIVIPNSVTSIGSSAFYGCTGLTSVTIPNGVTSIGGSAFYGCTGLTSIVIPDSVTSIGDNVFYNCSGLTSVTLPNNITTISSGTLAGCSSLTSITIPNGITTIGTGAFNNCSGLTTVTLPDTLTTINLSAFSGCSSLTTIDFPESLETIGNGSFFNCTGLTSITLPEGVTTVGGGAFANCSSLDSVTAKMETPPVLGGGAFGGISNTCVLTVPYPTKSAYIAAGWTESVFKGGVVEANIPVIEFADPLVKSICVQNWDTNGDGELDLAEAAAVTDIGTTFQSKSITSFDELQYFTELTSIGNSAFEDCGSLVSVVIPSSVTSIGHYAFTSCEKLTHITIPNSVTTIDYGAFSSCGLTSITIPNSVTSIGIENFNWCSNLSSIAVESGNPAYDSRGNCNAIIETTTNQLVAGCKNTIIPNSVTSIGENAFYGCDGLISIIIPNSVTSIGTAAFYECSSITSVTIGNSVTFIGSSAFQYCIHLTSVTIPNGVVSIAFNAFRNCNMLASITIPNSVTSIGNYAFYDCTNLASVVAEMETPFTLGSSTFNNISSSCVLTVPYGTRDAYIAAGWTETVFKGGVVEEEYIPGTVVGPGDGSDM